MYINHSYLSQRACNACCQGWRSRVGPQDKQVITHYRPPTLLTVAPMTRHFTKILGPPNQSGPQVFCRSLSPALHPVVPYFTILLCQRNHIDRKLFYAYSKLGKHIRCKLIIHFRSLVQMYIYLYIFMQTMTVNCPKILDFGE